ISLIDRSWPIASGVIDSGKTTVSFSGSTGSVAGSSSPRRSASSCSSDVTITWYSGSVTAGAPSSRCASRRALHFDRDRALGRLRRQRQCHLEHSLVVGRGCVLRVDL